MTASDDLDALYAEAARIVRVETLRTYLMDDEAARIQAWRDGTPRPERSVRTSKYLAEVALTTLTEGKQWQRLRVADTYMEHWSWYQRYQVTGYLESQAAGEEVLIVPAHPHLLALGDFVLFDETAAAFQSFDEDGRFTGIRVTRDAAEVAACVKLREDALSYARPLNVYLAKRLKAPRVA